MKITLYKNNLLNNSLIACFLMLQILLLVGHFYRYDIEHQLANWKDDTIIYDMFGGQSYFDNRDKDDTFDYSLYENVKSVDNAIKIISSHIDVKNEEEVFFATFDLVSKRFVHYMYPHYTFLQNPFLYMVDLIIPQKPYNNMSLADEKLKYSMGGSCGDAATVFTEIYRKLGFKARLVGLNGHVVAEAVVNGKSWFVDANMEAYSKNSIEEMINNPVLIDKAYSHRKKYVVNDYKPMFFTDNVYFDYDAVPSDSPRIYKVQEFLSWFKWFVYPIVLLLLLSFINRKK